MERVPLRLQIRGQVAGVRRTFPPQGVRSDLGFYEASFAAIKMTAAVLWLSMPYPSILRGLKKLSEKPLLEQPLLDEPCLLVGTMS